MATEDVNETDEDFPRRVILITIGWLIAMAIGGLLLWIFGPQLADIFV
jgi:hypothetical protein